MSKSTTLTLIDTLGLADTSNAECDRLYDDVVRELAMQVVLTESGTVAQVIGTATYSPPTNAIRILEMHGGYGLIDQMDYKSLVGLLHTRFRDQSGRATMWSHDHETIRDFRLVPVPAESDTLTVLVTQYQQNVPTWMEMPIALEVLYREYMRESNHQDVDFAMLCRDLATMWFGLVGIPWYREVKRAAS